MTVCQAASPRCDKAGKHIPVMVRPGSNGIHVGASKYPRPGRKYKPDPKSA
jgi:hypothetical protein